MSARKLAGAAAAAARRALALSCALRPSSSAVFMRSASVSAPMDALACCEGDAAAGSAPRSDPCSGRRSTLATHLRLLARCPQLRAQRVQLLLALADPALQRGLELIQPQLALPVCRLHSCGQRGATRESRGPTRRAEPDLAPRTRKLRAAVVPLIPFATREPDQGQAEQEAGGAHLKCLVCS